MNYDRSIAALLMAVGIVIATVVIASGFGASFQKLVDVEDKKTKVTAVTNCSTVAQSTWRDIANNAEVTEPVRKVYERCMQDMGYEIISENEATDSAVLE